MMSFISIVVLIFCFNGTSTLAQNASITSEELFTHWEWVTENIKQTRIEILARQDYELIELRYGAQQIKMKISEKFYVYNKPYRRAVRLTLEESDDKESIKCVINLNEELIQYDQEILELIDDRIIEGELLINNFIHFLNGILENVSELRSNVETCNRSHCISELRTLLSRIYEMVLQDIDTFAEELSDTVRYLSLNDALYTRHVQNFISKLRLCAYSNVPADYR